MHVYHSKLLFPFSFIFHENKSVISSFFLESLVSGDVRCSVNEGPGVEGWSVETAARTPDSESQKAVLTGEVTSGRAWALTAVWV